MDGNHLAATSIKKETMKCVEFIHLFDLMTNKTLKVNVLIIHKQFLIIVRLLKSLWDYWKSLKNFPSFLLNLLGSLKSSIL